MKLSLCTIVKNEADQLADFLESIHSAVDEIILVDTGSTDATRKIAQRYGCKIFSFPWIDDFSAARNFSIDQASGEWALILDPDERIAIDDIHQLRQLIINNAVGGYRFTIRSYSNSLSERFRWLRCEGEYSEEKDYPVWTSSSQIRLFRRLSNIRFTGEVYENTDHSFYDNNLILHTSPIPIHHYGLCIEPQCLLARCQEYIKLGYKKIVSHPYSSQAFFELASNLFELNEIDASIKLLEVAIDLDASRTDAHELLGIAYLKKENYSYALSCFEKAAEQNPYRVEILNHIAGIYLIMDDASHALPILERALFINHRHPETIYHIAHIFHQKQQTDTALQFVNKLLEISPEDSRGIILKAHILASQHEYDTATLKT